MLTYNAQGYAYWNEKRVPRVSEIVRLIAPRGFDVDEYFLRKGTLIHRIIQWKIEGCLDLSSVALQLMAYLRAYQQFTDDAIGFKTHKTERSFYSKKYGFCGRADIYAEFNGYLSVIDIKSGQPHEGDQYQTAAYLFGLKDAGLPCWRAFDLYLNGKGTYRLIEQKNPTSLFQKFLGGVKQWQMEQK